MVDDFEQTLSAAAEAVREHEVTSQRCVNLRDRVELMTAQLEALRQRYAIEQGDVARLEGVSLTRLLASLRGARDDALARERAEADLARYQADDAEDRLAAVRSELAAATRRREELTEAPAHFAELLDEKERRLKASGDPSGRRLLELAAERGRLTGESREVVEALTAARTAADALAAVEEKLGSASGWSTYDTFFGGGVISSAIKHSRLDEAARAAAQADQCIAVLRRELSDVDGDLTGARAVAIDGLTRFVDIWFDNIFTDFSVANRIRDARANVARSRNMVATVRTQLTQRRAGLDASLAGIEAERQRLLAP